MKKLNLKSLLALVLTLCMLLGSVAALAEEEIVAQGTEAPATEVPQVQTPAAETPATPAEPAAPAEATPTVTVAAGEAAGQVNVTITDDSNKTTNQAVYVDLDVNYTHDEATDTEKPTPYTSVNVNKNPALIDANGNALISGATDLNVNMGLVADNLEKPVVDYVDREYDENGNLIYEYTEYTNDANALDVYVGEVHPKGNVTFTTGDVYSASSAKLGNFDDVAAYGLYVSNYQKESTVTGTVNGDIFTKAAAPKTEATETDPAKKAQEEKNILNSLDADAYALSASAYNGATEEITVTGSVTAIATAVNGDAYARAERERVDEKAKATLTTGDVIANAQSSTGDANAIAVEYENDEGQINGTFGNLTATATGAVSADATGISYAYGDASGATALKTGSITATATLTENKNLKPDERQYAEATGAYVYADNEGATALETTGDITAKSDKRATGLYVNAYGADKKYIWDEKADKSVEVDATAPGKATAKVTGDITAEGTTSVNGVEVYAGTRSTYNEETKKSEVKDKQGGNVAVTVVGDVTATGSAEGKSTDLVSGVDVFAMTNASAVVAITGDVTATGKNSAGIRAAAQKDGKVDVLVDGTVTGGEGAIEIVKSSQTNEVDTEGKTTEGQKYEYDPNAVNLMVWKATDNAEGRIVTVYDQVTTDTETKGSYTDENGNTINYIDDNFEAVRTVDAEASAKLEQAIWYIVRVADAWKDNIAAKGTNTYAVDGTSYELAHQYEDVTLTLTIPKKKKLSAIYYNDGVKADFVKNEDGTYTVKMLRGGAMELGLKLKNKYKKAAATTTTATEDKKEEKNWAYGIEIEGVGTVYYGRDYFKLPDIVNPLTSEPYTEDEIKAIVDGAKEGAEGYVFDIPEEAYLGMNDFWYDKDAAVAITGHEDPLTIDDNGVFTTADGEEVAKPIQK